MGCGTRCVIGLRSCPLEELSEAKLQSLQKGIAVAQPAGLSPLGTGFPPASVLW